MRKPFLFLLVIFSFWVWSMDLVDILFYYAKHSYSTMTGSLIALIPFCILTYLFTKLFFKHYDLDRRSLALSKERIKEYLYLLVCFLPILYLNFKRLMFPDVSYDVGAYHLYLQELNRHENLKNFNLVGSAGGGTYFFTLSYKMFGCFRKLFGFRMGVILNTALLFVCFVSIYEFLKLVLKNYAVKLKIPLLLLALSSLFVIYADNTLFVLNSYMVDLIGIPILLELLFIIVFKKLNPGNGFNVTLLFFVLVSIAITYKLTYLPYVLVFSLCFISRNFSFFMQKKSFILLGFVTLAFPSIYLLYNYSETLNPIFPFYNKLFKSPLYEIRNFRDERWGPHTVLEIFYYNIVCVFDKERTNEWRFFSVRLLAEYFIILSCLAYLVINKFKFKNDFIKVVFGVSGIALLLNYILLIAIGYYRYGIIIEMLFGMSIILWLVYFFQKKNYFLFATVFILASIQCVNTFNRIYKRETNLSWYNYKDLWRGHKDQVQEQRNLIFRDKQPDLNDIISPLKIDGFLSSECDGYIRLLCPNTAIFNITSYGNREKVIKDFEKNTIDTFSRKHNLYFLARGESLSQKMSDLSKRNYSADTIINIYPSFTTRNMPLYLFKIKPCDADYIKNE
ncbi:MAG: hypothetical protein ABIN36_04330 [Ferruginibacter sp.]